MELLTLGGGRRKGSKTETLATSEAGLLKSLRKQIRGKGAEVSWLLLAEMV